MFPFLVIFKGIVDVMIPLCTWIKASTNSYYRRKLSTFRYIIITHRYTKANAVFL